MIVGVTGAAGHIGMQVCKDLIARKYEVSAFVTKHSDRFGDLPISQFVGDIRMKDSRLKDWVKSCEGIIHLAGIIGLDYKFNQNVYDVNVTGTRNILEEAKGSGIRKLVHVSSIHVFNHSPQDKPLDETRDFVSDKTVFYDRTKRDGHLLAQQFAKDGVDVSIVCPTGVFGPHDYKPSQLGKAIVDIYCGSVPAVVSGGFDFVDVRDVSNGIISSLEKGRKGEAYILGGAHYTIKEFADTILKIKGTKKHLAELPLFVAYLGLPFAKAYSSITGKLPLYDKVYLDILRTGNKNILHSKAQKELGYSPRPLEESLKDTIEWFRNTKKL